jgi:hypothetical protein
MMRLGRGALSHANWHANYTSVDNDLWPQLSVLQAAHAAEILIKARIAEEHPLLIFETWPRPSADGADLSLETLLESGRTIAFSELPARLWATTGIRLSGGERYRSFLRLRNAIQHFTYPTTVDVAAEALRFIYEVIDPFINDCWGLYAIDHNEDHEPYVYLVGGLLNREIPFLVSPDSVPAFAYCETDWPTKNASYCDLMRSRLAAAQEPPVILEFPPP